ncbi:hypothetical protein JXO52_00675 [bacterium]|nr:hypothetical protein [bacterium]
MDKRIDLVALEKQAFKSTFSDGLWDIMLGIVLLSYGVVPLLSVTKLGDFWSSLFILPFFGIGYGIWYAGKRRITIPRAGLMKIGPLRKKKIATIQIYLNIFLALGVITGFAAYGRLSEVDWLFPALLAIIILAGFSLGARYLDFSRLGWYGAGLTVLVITGELLFRMGMVSHHGFPLAFGVTGFTAIGTGILLLARFIRAYPVPVKEGPDET